MTHEQFPPQAEKAPHEQESQELLLQEQWREQETRRLERYRAEVHHGIIGQMFHAIPGTPDALGARQPERVMPITTA